MKITVFEKGKQKMNAIKGASAVALGSAVALASAALPVFAAEGGGGAEDAVVSGMTSAASSMTGLVTKAVPIVVPIMTAVIVVKFGMGLFKKLSGKASS